MGRSRGGRQTYGVINHVIADRRREDEFCKLPAIALTAFSGRENELRALREGFQIHLPKPVNPATLVAAIGKLVERNAVEVGTPALETRAAVL